jgi:tRNA(Ile2) C34 agmatinyltransferase TiaS
MTPPVHSGMTADNADLHSVSTARRNKRLAAESLSPMTTLCPVCAKPMKQNGRAFQCEPCRQIVIFFRVSDTSPYLESKRQSDHREARRHVDRVFDTLPQEHPLGQAEAEER